jgi:uncharacterized membrane protein YraQ (UPF0718 family)
MSDGEQQTEGLKYVRVLIGVIIALFISVWVIEQIDHIWNAGYYEALDNGYRAMEWCKVERNFTCCASTCAECVNMFQEEFKTDWKFACSNI